MSLDELYREVILDHYKHPRNRGRLPEADVRIALNNPVCGDEIELHLDFAGDRVAAAQFEGRGCSISQASASLMTEAVQGKSVAEAEELIAAFTAMMRGQQVDEAKLGDLVALQGVAKFPVRIKCALLAWEALSKGLQQWVGTGRPSP